MRLCRRCFRIYIQNGLSVRAALREALHCSDYRT